MVGERNIRAFLSQLDVVSVVFESMRKQTGSAIFTARHCSKQHGTPPKEVESRLFYRRGGCAVSGQSVEKCACFFCEVVSLANRNFLPGGLRKNCLASKLTDTMGKPANCTKLISTAVSSPTIVGGSSQATITGRNQRNSSPTPLFSILANQSLVAGIACSVSRRLMDHPNATLSPSSTG